MSPFIDNNSCMKFSVATSTADIADDDVTELVVVLRGTLGRLEVFDGATVVMRFWEGGTYVTYSLMETCYRHYGMNFISDLKKF